MGNSAARRRCKQVRLSACKHIGTVPPCCRTVSKANEERAAAEFKGKCKRGEVLSGLG